MPERPRVLCVDDEPQITSALALHLQRFFDVTTAESGEDGLIALAKGPPFSVVLSDMRMPGMNGAEFLSEVRARSPDTVRVLLTGHADMDSALAAINEGRIFRFLVKPCPARTVLETLKEGADQYRLVNAERDLLEHTLTGSVQVMTEILSLSSPLAFGRAMRVARRLEALCDDLEVKERWAITLAAPLYHLGFVTLPEGLAEKVHYGRALEPGEQALVAGVAAVSQQLVAHIPRLAPVREIIGGTGLRYDGAGAPPGTARGEAIPLGARLLRAALDLDALEASGVPEEEATRQLAARPGLYDPAVIQSLGMIAGHQVRAAEAQALAIASLRAGMVLAEDVRLRNGTLLVARQLTVTPSVLSRLRSLAPGAVVEPIKVIVR